MVIEPLRRPGDAIDERKTVRELLELEGPKNCLRTFQPVQHGCQMKAELFGG